MGTRSLLYAAGRDSEDGGVTINAVPAGLRSGVEQVGCQRP
jgi:hypothetical protein